MTTQAQVLEALRAYPGSTALELAAHFGTIPPALPLLPLRRKGLVTRVGEGYRDPYRWYRTGEEPVARCTKPIPLQDPETTNRVVIHTDGRLDLIGWSLDDIAALLAEFGKRSGAYSVRLSTPSLSTPASQEPVCPPSPPSPQTSSSPVTPPSAG